MSPKGKLVKQTSGNRTNGRKVPGIWIKSKIIETLINGLMIIVMPITTSHIPKIGTNVLGFSNQYTVFSTSSCAGLKPKGFRAPNQI